jgi:hypothetical protein
MPPGFLVGSSIGLDPGLFGPFFFLSFFLSFFLMLGNKQYIKGAGRYKANCCMSPLQPQGLRLANPSTPFGSQMTGRG